MIRRFLRRGTPAHAYVLEIPDERGAYARATVRVLDRRPLRMAATTLTVLTLVAAVMLVLAASAHASVWVIPATGRAFPTTQPGRTQAININAAGNEYQGFQVVLRGGGNHNVTFSWSSDTPALIKDNTVLDRVYYVTVRTPTSHLHSKPGPYPDPLVPRSFNQGVAIPASTTPFYLLTYVPANTPAGIYTGTLHVVNGSETVDLPMTLQVWGFNIKISADTAFAVSAKAVGRSIQGSGVSFEGQHRRDIMKAFIQMMSQHGISPTVPDAWPHVTSSGSFSASNYVKQAAPILDASGVNVHDSQVPWTRWFPWSYGNTGPSSSRLETYLTELFHVYAEQGWQNKAYTYLLDETTTHSEELLAQNYARLVHRASAANGFRMKFMLTDDPRPFALGGVKQADAFLYDDVDIWGVRYYYYFGRIPAIRAVQKRGAAVWWYSYPNSAVAKTPSFVIEKSPNDSRIWGWLMVKWNVQGLLNWGFNRWGKATTGNGWRDPYKNTLSYSHLNEQANGDTSLVYPGYYPRYGLNNPYAPPCSSLRLEALRDGLEEREYLLTAQSEPGGAAFVNKVLSAITWGPSRIRQANVFDFPGYTTSESVFDNARVALAQFIEAAQAQP